MDSERTINTGLGTENGLKAYLSPIGAWALAFGCSVGWGAFVMPGTTFLPLAGPLGTALGIGIAALIMLILAVNYHYLMNRYPDAGGTYTYTKICFGYDHGFLNSWFLMLTYIAIIWANASALPLIARNLLGDLFQFGFHYEIAGYSVYLGELILALCALCIAALLCLRGRVSVAVQTVMALVLCLGVVFGFVASLRSPMSMSQIFTPGFSPEKGPGEGIFTVIALGPWAFVGFESISHSSSEFSFSAKKSFRILALSVITAAAAYILLAVLAVSALPARAGSWPAYIMDLGSYSGMAGLPTFNAISMLLGRFGTVMLGFTALGAIMTGLIGNIIASSRLMYSMSKDNLLPLWFGKINRYHVPSNTILFIFAVSVVMPFLGRTAISWIVDVTTVGATIAYAYASAAALKTAGADGNRKARIFGIAGLAVSLFFILYFLIPNLLSVTVLSTESYLILAAWGMLGLMAFVQVFKKDEARRLGRSTVVWVVMLALIIFTSTVWMRQATEAKVDEVEETLFGQTVAEIRDILTYNSLVQITMIVFSLIVLFYIYSLMQKREKQIEVEKALAEESSRAKTSFLSNMSHEIRTPMNAIIGLDTIALKDPDLSPRTREHLEKIGSSARHLLGLINDILDMSRIESGRMVIKEEEFRFKDFLDQVNVIINGQCAEKGLDYECKIIGHLNDYYIGDDMKLRQVLINILGNAVKFTEVPGSVTLTVMQSASSGGYCTMRFIMSDTGIGISKEFIPRIFDTFSQENASSANKYGSTGLGMAITKNIVEMMNGEIEVESEKGVGSTFTVTVALKASDRRISRDKDDSLPPDLRLLIVDDDEVACEHAQLVAGSIGLSADTCAGGGEALARVKTMRGRGTPYHIVLTDYGMPGMNGIEFTRALHAIDGGETGVIILTGYNWDDMTDDAKDAGVDLILSKPLFTDSLLGGIQHVLRERGMERKVIETETPEQEDVQALPAEGCLEGMHVLVADDLEINAEILMDLLDLEGITADYAENGKLALEKFAESGPGTYEAVLMDVRMPVMDGLEATKAIRALEREDAKTVPIVALTANAFDEDVQRSLQAGMTAHLSKPVEPDRLYETLARLTHRS